MLQHEVVLIFIKYIRVRNNVSRQNCEILCDFRISLGRNKNVAKHLIFVIV